MTKLLSNLILTKLGENKMPQQDKTGPQGQGPLTGRGLGPCGAGAGIRRSFGRGMGNRFCPKGFAMAPQQVELTAKEEQKILEAEKQDIEKRLKELKA